MTVAPAGAFVWPSADANSVTSSSPPTRTAQGSEEIPDHAAGHALTPPEIGLSAERISFDSVRVGGPEAASSTEILTVRNDGDAPLSLEATTITGPNATAFEIVAGGGPTTLAPGERRAIAIMFAPESTGEATATLRIESDDPEHEQVTVDLAGTGVAPDIEVSPETLRFSNETDGPAAQTLTITNGGSAPLTVETIRIVGPDRTAFESAVDAPVTIDPNQSQSVTVTLDQTEARPRFATIHVMSDDPDEPQRNVWLTNTPMVADVSPSTVLADRTIVNTTVVNAQANTSHSINISWPLTRDDAVAVDSLTFTPERTENFTINVTKSSERFEGTPPFNLSDGTEDVAFVSMNGTIANEALSNVTVTFRVRKDQLAENETGPEDVTLYTHRNGTWTELPTELVDESPTHYFFEARSPGLLDFATGIKQAKFRIDDAVVSVTELRTGEGVDVLVRVTNVGGADGTHVVKLIRNDTVVDRRDLSIAPNGTRQTVFTQSFEQPGVYELYVNDRFVANVTVRSGENTTNASRFTRTVLSPWVME
jgi:PGF-pre-PGF domain-containing protein